MPKSLGAVVLVLLTFFVISFVTNILGAVLPEWVRHYQIGLTLAGLFPFAFFLAYGLCSIPAGLLMHRRGGKTVMCWAFALVTAGAGTFALWPNLTVALFALFSIGAGMALLQVVINPLLRVAGGETHFAFNSVLAQFLFGIGAALSPLAFAWASQQREVSVALNNAAAPSGHLMYAVFAVTAACMLLLTWRFRFPAEFGTASQEDCGAWHVQRELLKQPLVRRYFLAIVCYVATEQGLANSMLLFLERAHAVDPITTGADIVSGFWFAMTLGCLLGLLLLRLFDARHVLIGFVLAAAACLATALTADAVIAARAFQLSGFCLSVMWSILFSLALNSVPRHHGSFSGILCTGIVGGALISPVIGAVADLTGDMRWGLLLLFVCLFFIARTAWQANPLVGNARAGFTRKERAAA